MEPFLGAVMPFAFKYAPLGWYSCEGQALSIAQNTALFSLLGTMYGGDGQTTFKIPDLRGRTIIGQGQGPGLASYDVGEAAGATTATMTLNTMPAHNHLVVISANQIESESNDPANNYFGGGAGTNYTNSATDVQLNTAAATTSQVGNNMPFSIVNPYMAMFYCIAFEGIFPSRN